MKVATLVVLVACLCSAGARASDFTAPARAQTDGMPAVVELARNGAFTTALARAEALSNSLERAQARLYVLHQAGDLTGALAAGLEGLRAAPNDLWLLERVSYIALSLRSFELAREHVERFARALDAAELSPADRTHWSVILADDRVQISSLAVTADERASAAHRARWTVVIGAIALALTMLALARNDVRTRAG